MPDVRLEGRELVMFGRSIPVVDREQLGWRLAQIGCNREVAEEIVGSLFGFAVSTEAPVALSKVVENLV